jgi:hypothetical protein
MTISHALLRRMWVALALSAHAALGCHSEKVKATAARAAAMLPRL